MRRGPPNPRVAPGSYLHHPRITRCASQVKAAMEEGLVLTTSLWGGKAGRLDWLDGGCNSLYPLCSLPDGMPI